MIPAVCSVSKVAKSRKTAPKSYKATVPKKKIVPTLTLSVSMANVPSKNLAVVVSVVCLAPATPNVKSESHVKKAVADSMTNVEPARTASLESTVITAQAFVLLDVNLPTTVVFPILRNNAVASSAKIISVSKIAVAAAHT